jgi:ribosomal protein L40E
MFRTLTLTVVASLLATSMSAALAEDYYPLKEGNSWTYSLPAGGEMTIKVTGFEEVKGVKCARVEGEAAGQGKSSSWLAADVDGVRMYKLKTPQGEVEFGKPPLQIKLPFKQGDKWQARLPLQQPIDSEMESAGRETIKVPAGTFDCIRINTVVTVGDNKVTSSTWYADGVGQVQMTMAAAGQEMTIKLIKTNIEPPTKPVSIDTPKATDTSAADRICPKCGAKVSADAKFCTQCGAKMPPPAPVALTNCPKCGAKLQPGAKFCTECGAKIEMSAPPATPSFSSGPDKASPPSAPTQPLEVKQTTTKELVESDILASARVDFDAMVRLAAPEYKGVAKLFSKVLGKTTQMSRSMLILADATEKPFGKDVADALRAQGETMKPENFEKMMAKENASVYQDGKIAWDKITIDEKGDTATANWAGREHPLKMVKVDGTWYSTPGDDIGKTPQEAKAKVQKMLDGFDKAIAKFDEMTAKVSAGKMTKQEFGDAMQEIGKSMQDAN